MLVSKCHHRLHMLTAEMRSTLPLLAQLEFILEISLHRRSDAVIEGAVIKELSNVNSDSVDSAAESKVCNICYCATTSDSSDICCNNMKCNRVYHRQCLTRWLSNIAVRVNRNSHNIAFVVAASYMGGSAKSLIGQCPYCFEDISLFL